MADVSALDSTQTDVALTMGADGSYSVDVLSAKRIRMRTVRKLSL